MVAHHQESRGHGRCSEGGPAWQSVDSRRALAIVGGDLGRDRGEKGKAHQTIKARKKKHWEKHNNWPWWDSDESEKYHWAGYWQGNGWNGGQCTGLFWRHARDAWLRLGEGTDLEMDLRAEALEAYDQKWKDLYGDDAFEASMKATEDAYQQSKSRGETLESLWSEAQAITKQILDQKMEKKKKGPRDDERSRGNYPKKNRSYY